jgi:hypothetical protein
VGDIAVVEGAEECGVVERGSASRGEERVMEVMAGLREVDEGERKSPSGPAVEREEVDGEGVGWLGRCGC